jgi:hypothetical protein
MLGFISSTKMDMADRGALGVLEVGMDKDGLGLLDRLDEERA